MTSPLPPVMCAQPLPIEEILLNTSDLSFSLNHKVRFMSKNAAQLHALIAVLGDLEQNAKKFLNEAAVTFQKKPDHFLGQTKRLEMFDEAREQENSHDTKAMATTVTDKVNYFSSAVSKYYDALLQMETTNQHARADLIIDGTTLATDLPATFLLGMEKRLATIRAVYETVPTLNPGIDWAADPSASTPGVYVATTETVRTEKSYEPFVLYEATKEHPAQVKEINVDRPVGKIKTTQRSSMWTPARKAVVLGRIDKLIRATKKARQKANSVEVVEVRVGKAILDYINAE